MTGNRETGKATRPAFLAILGNPFTMTVSGCAAIALLGSLVLPLHQLDSLDKALSLLETALCFWIAYPASVAFGQVLLQTAPAGRTIQMAAFERAVREVRKVCRG